jgi:hypothetical protein
MEHANATGSGALAALAIQGSRGEGARGRPARHDGAGDVDGTSADLPVPAQRVARQPAYPSAASCLTNRPICAIGIAGPRGRPQPGALIRPRQHCRNSSARECVELIGKTRCAAAWPPSSKTFVRQFGIWVERSASASTRRAGGEQRAHPRRRLRLIIRDRDRVEGRRDAAASPTPARAAAESSRWFALHGIVPVHIEAMPTIGAREAVRVDPDRVEMRARRRARSRRASASRAAQRASVTPPPARSWPSEARSRGSSAPG